MAIRCLARAVQNATLWSAHTFHQMQEEDDRLSSLVRLHGTKTWAFISKQITGRNGKQCRERWHNHLSPGLKKVRLSSN
jgi:hypothetical protein